MNSCQALVHNQMIAGYRWWESRSWKRPTPMADGFTTAVRVSFLSAVNCADGGAEFVIAVPVESRALEAQA